MMTRKEFRALSPWAKGVAVYMSGHAKAEPNIPNHYSFRSKSRQRDYERGQLVAWRESKGNP